MQRREYSIEITVNGRAISKVVIDPHYEIKHSSSVNDQRIVVLVKQLDGQFFEPDTTKKPYQYFVADNMESEGKLYRLVWLLEDDELYVGVVNAHRR